jgi:hypothetical protein
LLSRTQTAAARTLIRLLVQNALFALEEKK